MAQTFANSGDQTNYTASPPSVVGNLISGLDRKGIIDGFGVVQPLGGGGTSRADLVYFADSSNQILQDTPDAKITGQVQAYDIGDFDQQTVVPSKVPTLPTMADIPEAPEYDVPSFNPAAPVGITSLDSTLAQLSELGTEADTTIYVAGTIIKEQAYSSISWGSPMTPSGGEVHQVIMGDTLNDFIVLEEETIYITSNGGSNWTNITPGGWPGEGAMAACSDLSVIAVIGGEYIYVSINSGSSWNSYIPWVDTGGGIPTLEVSADGSCIVVGWIACDIGVWISTNSGVNWSRGTSSVLDVSRVCLSSDGTYMMAACGDSTNGVYFSNNRGRFWKPIYPAGAISVSWSTCGISDSGTILIAGTSSQLYRSENGGSSWETVSLSKESGFAREHLDEYGTRILLQDGIANHISSDGGITWDLLTHPSSDYSPSVSISPDGLLIGYVLQSSSELVIGTYTITKEGYGFQSWGQTSYTPFAREVSEATNSAEAITALDLDIIGGGNATSI